MCFGLYGIVDFALRHCFASALYVAIAACMNCKYAASSFRRRFVLCAWFNSTREHTLYLINERAHYAKGTQQKRAFVVGLVNSLVITGVSCVSPTSMYKLIRTDTAE
jgi:hypothetical protein